MIQEPLSKLSELRPAIMHRCSKPWNATTTQTVDFLDTFSSRVATSVGCMIHKYGRISAVWRQDTMPISKPPPKDKPGCGSSASLSPSSSSLEFFLLPVPRIRPGSVNSCDIYETIVRNSRPRVIRSGFRPPNKGPSMRVGYDGPPTS